MTNCGPAGANTPDGPPKMTAGDVLGRVDELTDGRAAARWTPSWWRRSVHIANPGLMVSMPSRPLLGAWPRTVDALEERRGPSNLDVSAQPTLDSVDRTAAG